MTLGDIFKEWIDAGSASMVPEIKGMTGEEILSEFIERGKGMISTGILMEALRLAAKEKAEGRQLAGTRYDALLHADLWGRTHDIGHVLYVQFSTDITKYAEFERLDDLADSILSYLKESDDAART